MAGISFLPMIGQFEKLTEDDWDYIEVIKYQHKDTYNYFYRNTSDVKLSREGANIISYINKRHYSYIVEKQGNDQLWNESILNFTTQETLKAI